MKCILQYTNRYLKRTDWKDLALIKICMCAFGIVAGLLLPQKARKPAVLIAVLAFLISLMGIAGKFFGSDDGQS